MASVVHVKEAFDGRGGSFTGAERQFTRVFKVRFDAADATPWDAATAADPETNVRVPNHGEPYSDQETYAVVTTINPVQQQTPYDWLVTVEYGAWRNRNPAFVPPLDAAPQVSWVPLNEQEPYAVDVENMPVINSAKQPFDPLPQRDAGPHVLTIRQPEVYHSIQKGVTYKNTINQGDWKILGYNVRDGSAKCMGITAESQRYAGFLWYWNVTYVFHLRPEPWDQDILDQGVMQLVETSTGDMVLEHIWPELAVAGGEVVQQNVLLDGNGKPLKPGEDPVFLKRKPYRRVSFNGLPLPRSWPPREGYGERGGTTP